MKRYYSLEPQGKDAVLYIYGDITSWPWDESDVSSCAVVRELEALDAETLHVYINSYGGEVAEGLAIHNALCRHSAKVITNCDGFACSVASVIFMAGDERVMPEASLLFIHNAWTYAQGDANSLRKEADDLETITQASISAYLSRVNVGAVRLQEMLDQETWITAQEALEMGFATAVTAAAPSQRASQSVRQTVARMMMGRPPQAPPKAVEEPDPSVQNLLQSVSLLLRETERSMQK